MLHDVFLKVDSAVGHYGVVKLMEDIISEIQDPIDREFVAAFLDATTARLSEDDLDALGEEVLSSITIEWE